MSGTTIAEALARVLEDVAAGRTPDEALAALPSLRAELEPLVRLATLVSKAGEIEPSPVFRSQSPRRLRARLHSSRGEAGRSPRRSLFSRPLSLRPAWVLVSAVILALLAASGVGVAYAADSAVPGDPLYGVDRAIESLRLGLTPSHAGRARLALAHAAERLAEVQALAVAGPTSDDVATALDDYGASIALAAHELAQLAAEGDQAGAEALAALLGEALSIHHHALADVREKVPAPAQAAIDRAIEGSRATFDATEAGLPSGSDEGDAQSEDPGPPGGIPGGQPEGVPGGPPGGTPPGPPDGVLPRSPGPFGGSSSDPSQFESRVASLGAQLEIVRGTFQGGDLEAGRLKLWAIEQEVNALSLDLAGVAAQDSARAQALALVLDVALTLSEQVLAELMPQAPPEAMGWVEAALAASHAGRQTTHRFLGEGAHPGPPGGVPVGPLGKPGS